MRKYMLVLAALLMPVLLSVSAYASSSPEDIVQPGAGNYIPVIGAIDDLAAVMVGVWAVIVSNPLFVVLVAASLFALGVRIFKKVKGAAKG